MQKKMTFHRLAKNSVLAALCAMGAIATAPRIVSAADAVVEYRDVGNKTDFDATQNIYFDQGTPFGGSDQPKYWVLKVNGQEGAFFENSQNFWWVTAPPADAKDLIGSRCITLHQYGRFRVKADKLPADGDLILTLRAKDDLSGPAPVFVWSGEKNWTELGDFGGKYDHAWKTVQYTVPAGKAVADNGTYVFKIGVDSYKDTMKGELPVDRIALGTTKDRAQFPDDQPGYWPEGPANKFKDFGSTMEYVKGQGPFFMYGMYGLSWVTDGGSATTAGKGKMDSWQILEDAKINTYVIHGWSQPWLGTQWKTFPNEFLSKRAKPGVVVEPSLEQHLVQAAGHHLMIIPNFLTDTRQDWIKKQYKGEAGALAGYGKIFAAYDQNPNLLAWYPVDEWDHEDGNYGKPILYSHLIYNQARESSPDRPTFVLLMGFKGKDAWRVASETTGADIIAVDCYPSDFKGDLTKGLIAQGKQLDTIRSVVGWEKPYVLVPELLPNSAEPKRKQIYLGTAGYVAQAYAGIIHGARGLLYFRFLNPASPIAPKDIMVGPTQVGEELFGPEGISSILLPPSKPVEFTGAHKIVTCSNPAVQATLFEDGKGHRVLITLNTNNAPVAGVQFKITGLKNGPVKTRFENGRTVQAQDAAFTDDYDAVQRHVYDLPN